MGSSVTLYLYVHTSYCERVTPKETSDSELNNYFIQECTSSFSRSQDLISAGSSRCNMNRRRKI